MTNADEVVTEERHTSNCNAEQQDNKYYCPLECTYQYTLVTLHMHAWGGGLTIIYTQAAILSGPSVSKQPNFMYSIPSSVNN